MRFEILEDYKLYLSRLIDFPKQVDDYIAAFREGLRLNIVASTAMMRNVQAQLKDIIASSLEDMHAPLHLENAAAILSGTTLYADIEQAINDTRGHYERFHDFLGAEYLPHVRQDPACKSLPNGEAVYAACLRLGND
jgi:uncharacterized protein (DUF885 family)